MRWRYALGIYVGITAINDYQLSNFTHISTGSGAFLEILRVGNTHNNTERELILQIEEATYIWILRFVFFLKISNKVSPGEILKNDFIFASIHISSLVLLGKLDYMELPLRLGKFAKVIVRA